MATIRTGFQAVAFSPDGDQVAYSGEDTSDSQATLCVLTLSPANLSLGSPTAAAGSPTA